MLSGKKIFFNSLKCISFDTVSDEVMFDFVFKSAFLFI